VIIAAQWLWAALASRGCAADIPCVCVPVAHPVLSPLRILPSPPSLTFVISTCKNANKLRVVNTARGVKFPPTAHVV
jgi:hypothetical protein